jgi:RimJ/RimL family protein N-acetyltransferase
MFDQAWSIYNASFSDFERRSLFEQMQVMRQPRYRFSAIRKKGAVVGVLGVWHLRDFCFVEHVAIAPEHRSGGYGRRALQALQRHVRGPIILDVEPFGTDLAAARRVAFYQRLGFHYCGHPVSLPPYAGKTAEPSNLMSWPLALDGENRERAVEAIARDVYGLHPLVPRHRAV